jgi:hypothetical protein
MSVPGFSATRGNLAVKPQNILRNNGALQGGESGQVTSLLDLRKSIAKGGKLERIVVDVGSADYQKLKGRLGYYTVELKKGQQVIVNFGQTLNSKFSEKDLAKKLRGSAFVRNSKMLFDPMSQTLSLVMDLKKPATVKVISVSGSKETGKLVLDFMESKAL